jgi:hypothetical protein
MLETEGRCFLGRIDSFHRWRWWPGQGDAIWTGAAAAKAGQAERAPVCDGDHGDRETLSEQSAATQRSLVPSPNRSTPGITFH